MHPQIVSLFNFPGRVVRQSLPSEAIAPGLLAFGVPSTRRHSKSRLALDSRVADVAPIATLASLSMGTVPMASPIVVQSSTAAALSPAARAIRRVEPSHLKTLGVAGYVHPTLQSAVWKADPQLALPLNPGTTQSRVADERASTVSAENGTTMEHIQVGLPMATQVPDSPLHNQTGP